MGRKPKTAPGIGERIASLMNPGETQAMFASSLGVPDRTVGNYLRGDREPSYDFLVRLREKRDADLNWLLGRGPNKRPPSIPMGVGEGLVPLPRYDIQASAGPGAVALAEDVQDFMSVSREWLSRYVSPSSRIGVIEARGDSMEPTIRDGDILMVTHDIDGDDVAGGGIFVISVEGHLMVKRLQRRLNGDMQIVSDNECYENETIPADQLAQKLTVHARVFWHGGPI